MLTIADFDYFLDPQMIAQRPLERRDRSRLMVLNRDSGRASNHIFTELPTLLRKGDLLVLNDTRVIPAKFTCRRPTGAKLEGLFLREDQPGNWEILLNGAGRCRPGERLVLVGGGDIRLELLANLGRGRWRVAVRPVASVQEVLQQAGLIPLPPYIRRPGVMSDPEDRQRYQTVYAETPGAVAAPTAGLHFTDELLADLAEAGIETARVTLHVGLGTFAPVKCENLAEHKMHTEWYELSAAAAEKLDAARQAGRRIVAVGTTSLRVLETVGAERFQRAQSRRDLFAPASGWTDLFVYPPADFRAVDAMITNFHLPRSTLLMLVAAFCSPGRTDGVKMILDAYATAQQMEYRFYSYGDAMLIE